MLVIITSRTVCSSKTMDSVLELVGADGARLLLILKVSDSSEMTTV
jgi:hypothetical protein